MTRPVITLAGIGTNRPSWVDEMAAKIGGDYILRYENERADYVPRLVDNQTALIIVDGDGGDWRFWTATPKSSPATRRIPVFLVTEDETIRQEGITSGADRVFAPAELVEDIGQLAADFARVVDPEQAERLDCECREALPELGVQAIEKFNAGEYYRQHDLFEELWMKTDGPVRDLYRAILQVGIAYYHITRGNHRGARKMLLRSVQWLAVLPDECQGVDVKALREDSYRVRAELEKLPEDQIGRFDRTLLKPVRMVEDRDLNARQ